MDRPGISTLDHAEDVSCAFCGSFRPDKVMIANQHEGVGSVICQGCVNSLDAFFINNPEARP